MFCVLIFKTLGAGDPIMLMIFMIFGGLKIMGACGWLFRGHVVWGWGCADMSLGSR